MDANQRNEEQYLDNYPPWIKTTVEQQGSLTWNSHKLYVISLFAANGILWDKTRNSLSRSKLAIIHSPLRWFAFDLFPCLVGVNNFPLRLIAVNIFPLANTSCAGPFIRWEHVKNVIWFCAEGFTVPTQRTPCARVFTVWALRRPETPPAPSVG